MKSMFCRHLKPALLLVACLAVVLPFASVSLRPVLAASHQSPSHQAAGPSFEFGREGGNIRPFTVSVDEQGNVTVNGGITYFNKQVRLSRDAVGGLLKLAKAEKFYGLPNQISGKGLFPDTATLYITINTGTVKKTVRLHAAQNSHFSQMFSVLMAVAGVSF